MGNEIDGMHDHTLC